MAIYGGHGKGDVSVPPDAEAVQLFGRTWIVITIAIVVVVAGIGVTSLWLLSVNKKVNGPAGLDDPGNGLTFTNAFEPVNATIANLAGGPWQLTSILGIASEVPAAPLPNYRDSLNQTLRICGQLPGVTIWNSSGVPVFTGSLNSGAAPFWSFIYKNTSQTYIYATNLEGTIRVDGPSSAFASCVQEAGLGSSYIVNPSVDTPNVAQAAYSAAGEVFSINHSPLVEYYVLGSNQLLDPDASPFGWVVNYFRCDLVGVSGLENYTAVGNLSSGRGSGMFVDNGWLTCTLPSYRVAFGASTGNSTSTFDNTMDVHLPFGVLGPQGALTNNSTLYDGWGLVSWMTHWELVDGTGQSLPVSPATCQSWVATLADCPANSSGWFAVLLSQNGGWLDSYPSATNSSAWAVPNVILSSQDQLVLVCAGSWNLTADALSVLSAPSAPEITGSASL